MKVSITIEKRTESGWIIGKVNGYKFFAKVYDEESDYGINLGRVSKLSIEKEKGNIVLNYDRGWDIVPKTPEVKEIYIALMNYLEKYPKLYKEVEV